MAVRFGMFLEVEDSPIGWVEEEKGQGQLLGRGMEQVAEERC